MLPGKLFSTATTTLSSILAVDLCYPYVTMLASDPIHVYLADIYIALPYILSHVVCLPVGLVSHSCMLRFVVASLSIFYFTCLV